VLLACYPILGDPASGPPGAERSGERKHVEPTRVDAPAAAGRVLTVPNIISFARLAGVPLFLYLFLFTGHQVTALVVLALGGTSDWVDGYLARRLRQVSRLGALLDPLADRLYILATLLAFTARDVIPWPFTAALLLRELVVGATIPVLRRYGYGPLPVHYVGKTATFILLFAFPVLLLARASSDAAPVAGPAGWGLAWWGIALYWVAGVLYLLQFRAVVRAARRERRGDGAVPA
jgi:cardiolipin synthase